MLTKIRIFNQDSVTRIYKFCHVTVFKKVIGKDISIWVLGLPLVKFANKKHPLNAKRNIKKFIKILKEQEHIILWIDHSLGGGTNTYSNNQFKEHPENTYIRMQYFAVNKAFHLNVCNMHQPFELIFPSLTETTSALEQVNIEEIIINNLVGYPKSTDILDFVTNYKQNVFEKQGRKIKVSFRGHDYHSICPSYNLLNYEEKYCKLEKLADCEQCLSKKMFSNSDYDNNILRSGATSIKQWRDSWNKFFNDTLNEFIAFSQEVSEIFFMIYPQLKDKTIIIPHKTRTYPEISIKPHKGINIAFLGEMNLVCKGKDILEKMLEITDEYQDVNLKIIGISETYDNRITSTGRYSPEKLPDLMRREEIDLVFISSIWPETFSYTTSEAMSMGLPVACFNFGAPYERVKSYSKGLVLYQTDARYILDNIIAFINKINNKE